MRIKWFEIENYRGIRYAKASALNESPLVLLTGRNGTGKSLVLEALTAAWSGNINLPEFVGPYGHSLSIRMAVTLEEAEREAIDTWRSERDLSQAIYEDEHVLEALSTSADGTGSYTEQDDVLLTLQNPIFSRSHPFATIDLLSARRQVSIDTTTSVDLKLLDRTTVADDRRRMYEQEIRWKSSMQMPDVGAYLTSLDYRDFIAGREGLNQQNEYSKLVDIFKDATGKLIRRPQFDSTTIETSINVELVSGQIHRLEDLSNGEREMLGMLYYVSQLSSHGGVLLLDEPEKHLHPSLQLAVLKAMMSVADRGQLIVVTHSPALISAASRDDVLAIEGAWASNGNQVLRIEDEDLAAGVLADLGVTKRELFQFDVMLVVEGEHDKSRLQLLFPDEIARAKVVVAGSRDRVLRMHSSLQSLDLPIPWGCIIDRDFYDEKDFLEKNSLTNMFVWHYRMLENILLDPTLLEDCLRTLGPSVGEIEQFLVESAAEQRSMVADQFVEDSIKRVNLEAPSLPKDLGTEMDAVERRLVHQKLTWEYRLEKYSETRSKILSDMELSWETDWRKFVSGKIILSAIQKKWTVYNNHALLTNSLLVCAREKPELLPKEFGRLQCFLRDLVSNHNMPVVAGERGIHERDAVVSQKLKSVTGRTPELNVEDTQYQGLGC